MGDVEGVSERKKMTLDDAADRSLYCNRKKKVHLLEGRFKKERTEQLLLDGSRESHGKSLLQLSPLAPNKVSSLFSLSFFSI